jgi:hypothetical protein
LDVRQRLQGDSRKPTIRDMKKSGTKYTTNASGRRKAATAVPKKLVAVRKAAQKPTHASRAAIRRAIRAVAGEWREANA